MIVDELVPLWGHQKEALEKATDERGFPRDCFAFFMEQGTGKTPTTTTLLRILYAWHKRPLKTLIFCPNIVVENWAEEIDKFSKCGSMVQMLRGPKKKRVEALQEEGKHIFVTNYEALDMEGLFWELTGSKGKEYRKLIDHGFEVLICDESHRLKNPSAKRTKLVIKMADKIPFRYELSGTPILNSLMDIWSQFRILDRGQSLHGNYFHFRNKFFQDKNAGMPTQRYFPDWQPRLGAEGAINKIIYDKAIRVEKKDCLDLPPLIQKRCNVEMSAKQRKHYDEMKQDFITYLNSQACTAPIALTKALRLQQICSGFLQLESGEVVDFPHTGRIKALQELLEDHAQGGEKAIVWAAFKQNYKTIAKVCDKIGVDYYFLTGEQKAEEKSQSVHDFTKMEGSSVLIANPGAGGTGVNLVEASTAIWFSRTFKLEDRLQALARNHRGGSEIHEKITSIDLVSPGSIDEQALKALDEKESIADRVLDIANEI